jgi:hypothetical protein
VRNVLQGKYGSFVANNLIPEFSVLSLFDPATRWSYIKGSAVTIGLKGLVGTTPIAIGRTLMAAGTNAASIPGFGSVGVATFEEGAAWATAGSIGSGVLLAGGVGLGAFSTWADYQARQQCQASQ